MKNPCKDCERRALKCHDSCKEYLAWREEQIAANKAHSENMKRAKEVDRRLWAASGCIHYKHKG